jgi:hypothetical protein
MPITSTVLPLLAAVALSHGGGDRDEVRAAGTCGGGVRSTLELKADDGAIEVEFEARGARRNSTWRVTLSQEGRVEWRGSARARGGSGSFRIRRDIRDLEGADRVSVRASGPRGVTCRVTATLPGD